MTVQAAFYKKPGNWQDRVIRWRTMSPYSHSELVADGLFYSSSYRDGGVVCRGIEPDPDIWDFLPVPWVSADAVREFYQNTSGFPYDMLGVMAGQSLAAGIQSKEAYFCSEWCATACGFSEPWRYSPGLFYNVLKDFNRAGNIITSAA